MDPAAETIATRYRRRSANFSALVAGVPADRWDWPSPCADWDARGVVVHVVGMHAAMLAPLGLELQSAPTVQEDPPAALAAAVADVLAVLDDPELSLRTVDTPVGPTSCAEHIDSVVSEDLVIHGWDLARATGQDDTIDPVDLELIWPRVQEIPDVMRVPEAFGPGIVVYGPEVPVPEDASRQDRALGLLGRDPDFVPGPATQEGERA